MGSDGEPGSRWRLPSGCVRVLKLVAMAVGGPVLLYALLAAFYLVPMWLSQARLVLPPSVGFRARLLESYRERGGGSAGGRAAVLQATRECDAPDIWRVESFLSEGEADYIVGAYSHLFYNCPFGMLMGRKCSEITSGLFSAHRDELLFEVDRRMDALVGQRLLGNPRNLLGLTSRPSSGSRRTREKSGRATFQMVRYGTAGTFPPHHDQGEPQSGGPNLPMPLTLMVYLNDVPPGGGGETVFPWARCGAAATKLSPRKGDLVLWSSCHPRDYGRLDEGTVHTGAPVEPGSEKFILNKFYTAFDYIDPQHCVGRRWNLRGELNTTLERGIGVTYLL